MSAMMRWGYECSCEEVVRVFKGCSELNGNGK